MEVTDFMAVLFNPIAQAKFVHTVSAGYVLASVVVLGVSAWYLLNGRFKAHAARSMTVASAFGLASALSVLVLGDESGYTLTDNQRMKLAAIEAEWHTEKAPAGLALFGIPDFAARKTHLEVKVPWVLGLIATRSLHGEVFGITELVRRAEERIGHGIAAYDAVERLKAAPADIKARADFEIHRNDLGYALLLKRIVDDPRKATPEQIAATAWDTVPSVPLMFWSFRVMAGIGFLMIALFALAFVLCSLRLHTRTPWFWKLCVAAIPLPWIAIELGWIVAEMGRQPWAIDGVLPTFLAPSSLSRTSLWITLVGFTALYGVLAVIEVRLMLAAIRHGPIDHRDEPQPAPGSLPATPMAA